MRIWFDVHETYEHYLEFTSNTSKVYRWKVWQNYAVIKVDFSNFVRTLWAKYEFNLPQSCCQIEGFVSKTSSALFVCLSKIAWSSRYCATKLLWQSLSHQDCWSEPYWISPKKTRQFNRKPKKGNNMSFFHVNFGYIFCCKKSCMQRSLTFLWNNSCYFRNTYVINSKFSRDISW